MKLCTCELYPTANHRITSLSHDVQSYIYAEYFATTGVLCKIGFPSETHLKLKSHKIAFAHNIRFNNAIVLKCCSEHRNVTTVLCAKFQNDWTTGADFMNERDLRRFEFKMSFGRISYNAQHTGCQKGYTLVVVNENMRSGAPVTNDTYYYYYFNM